MLTRKQFLMNLSIGVPAALATTTGIGSLEAMAEEAAPDVSRGFISVTDFGAAGDGEADDTRAIQAALDTGRNVYFPGGNYRVTGPMTVKSPGQTLFSENENQSVSNANCSTIFLEEDIEKPLFVVGATMVTFKGLNIVGPGKASKSTGILFRKLYNSDDVDVKVAGCVIKYFYIGVRIEGRGLRMQTNTLTSLTEAVQIDWPTEKLHGEGLQRLPYGMRGFYFFNNRVHTCSTFIVNEGEKAHHMWGMSIIGNLLDIGDALFRGSATYSLLSDNVICHTRRTPLFFNGLCHSTSISNNIISGGDTADGKRPGHGIWFKGECRDVTISGNVFANIRKSALAFDCEKQEHVVISGNTFNNIGLDQPTDDCVIKFAQPAGQFAITGNSFRPGPEGAASILHAAKDSLENIEMLGNVCEKGKELLSEV